MPMTNYNKWLRGRDDLLSIWFRARVGRCELRTSDKVAISLPFDDRELKIIEHLIKEALVEDELE